jgi:hypothetical protein
VLLLFVVIVIVVGVVVVERPTKTRHFEEINCSGNHQRIDNSTQ